MRDWRNRENYGFQNLPDYCWAWEFLRRNPDYRKDWESALSRFQERTGEWADLDAPRVKVVDSNSPDFYLPVAQKDKWFLGWGLVNPNTDRPRFLSLTISYGRVNFVPDLNQLPPGWVIDRVPITDAPEYLPAVIRFGDVNFVRAELVQREPNGLRYPWIAFDLELSLKPQLQRAHETLKHLQSQYLKEGHVRTSKNYIDLWPRYLRLLDADLDERKPKDIADVLRKEEYGIDEKKVWDQLEAAKRLTRPDGYLAIVLSPPPRASK